MPALTPRPWCRALPLMLPLMLWPGAAAAQTLVSADSLESTENAVFLDDGRYFVAGADGIHEIKPEADSSSDCTVDPERGLTVCRVLPPELEGGTCLYSGMTTDGQQLYAACTETGGSPLGVLTPPRAALVRLRPEGDGFDVAVAYFEEPTWYNGMAVMEDGSLLMSRSLTGTITNADGPAIDRVEITDEETLALRVRPWLDASPVYLLPNGIQVEGRYAYFVGGQNVFRIRIRRDGSAGRPVLLHQTLLNHTFDDFVIVGDYLAIADIAVVNGLGFNFITFVRKTGSLFPERVFSGTTQLSSLAVDPGTFGTPGDLIGTSFFQGGVHRFED